MLNIDLSGKLAVVTGATGELGREIARTLGRCGANVVVHFHRNEERASELCAELTGLGVKSMAVQADISRDDSVNAMQKAIAATMGDANIIVNNAVAPYGWKSVLDQPIADYESQFRSCVLHNVLMAKAFAPAMIRATWGRIIAINTECSMQAFPTQSAYVAGKRGQNGIVRVLAKEVGAHQITVNEVAPGWTISERDRLSGRERQPSYEQDVPLRHRGEDHDIANVVAFLASDLARYITGAYIPVCGGNVIPGI